MKKSITLLIISFICLLSTACSKNTLYITPEAVGYIYDSKTYKPLINQTGNMGFSGLTNAKDEKVILKEDGSFSIPAVTNSYYFIRPKVGGQYVSPPPEISIYFKGYETKIIDYSNTYAEQIPEGKSSFSHYKRINLGIIYLDPKK